MAGLVVGGELLLRVGEGHRLAALAHQHPVPGVLEVLVADLLAALAHGVQGGLVDQVGQLGTAHAGGAPGDDVEVDLGARRLPLVWTPRMARRSVVLGQGHDDLAVEAARAQQGGIEDVGPVGGRHHHDALGGLEAVHLVEHLVEGLLALVVAAAQAGAALAADGVDLVDEDDGPAHLLGRLEQVADPAGADADEHLHEVRARHRQERHAGLAGDRPGDEGLAGAGGTDQQDALGDAGADLAEALGVLQEVDDLVDLGLDALVAGDVGEGGARPLGAVGLGLAPADGHDVAHLARGPAVAAATSRPPKNRNGRSSGSQVARKLGPGVLGVSSTSFSLARFSTSSGYCCRAVVVNSSLPSL